MLGLGSLTSTWLGSRAQAYAREKLAGFLDLDMAPPRSPDEVVKLNLSDLDSKDYIHRYFDGEKFPGGFGPTELLTADYWTLRERSGQLFKTNLYARGIIRRLITNIINTGLSLEATPDESIVGPSEDWIDDWSDQIENRFHVWEEEPALCDWRELLDFGAMQRAAKGEALVAGDVLVVLHQDRQTRLPKVELIPGALVQTPFADPRRGNEIRHGVELDARGRQVAYWIQQEDDLKFRRLPAYGERSGRRIAWLVYGTDRRLDEVRGEPILALLLQSLREIDRYRDAALRKAVINSILAMLVTQKDGPGTLPMGMGAVRAGQETVVDTTDTERSFNIAEHYPGLVFEKLAPGEDVKAYPAQGTDEKYGEFEEAMVQAFAWALEVPPEIMRLTFSHNYAASQGAVNEFKMFLNKERSAFGKDFCRPIYRAWLIAETLTGRVDAPGFIDAWRDPEQWDVFGAWTLADWSGHIKPSSDILKQAKGYEVMEAHGWITNGLVSRELTGRKFRKNIRQLKKERELLAGLAPSPASAAPTNAPSNLEDDEDEEQGEDREAA